MDRREDAFGSERKEERAETITSEDELKNGQEELILVRERRKRCAAAAAKELGADLQTVADSIAQAASVGISTDLEAAAKGLGYDSFSDAVSAYNAEHGTNYTEAEAKEALGQ